MRTVPDADRVEAMAGKAGPPGIAYGHSPDRLYRTATAPAGEGTGTTRMRGLDVLPERTYCFKVATLRSGVPAGWSATTCAPSALFAPGQLSATAAPGAVSLSWSDRSSHEDGFEIRCSVNGGVFTTLTTVGANSSGYRDSAVTAGSTYRYMVSAVAKSWHSSVPVYTSSVTVPS